jgi:ATPase, AAA family
MQNLAHALRPKTIDELIGQHKLKPVFNALLQKQNFSHSIFFGSPGSGKTSTAKIIANSLNMDFYELDASNLKIEDIRKIIASHEDTLLKPLIFIDEIHRLSKTQQETLLIPMERARAIIIGATTENPYYALTAGIRSRSLLFEFEPLNAQDLELLLKRTLEKLNLNADENAKEYLISSSAGDARAMLNLLEFASELGEISIENLRTLRPHALKDGVSSSQTHYNLASALIKSLRGSDAQAAIYYLARLIDGGESPDFIARRMVILASEDIGNANPNALNIATNTLTAVSKIGYPEARIILSQCAIYLACSPKSNSSYVAINAALKYVRENPPLQIPPYLINNTQQNAQNYLYPHDFGGYVEQKYTQIPLKFYENKGIGFEKTLNEWVEKIKEKDR